MIAFAVVSTLQPHFGSRLIQVEHQRFVYLVGAIVVTELASYDPFG